MIKVDPQLGEQVRNHLITLGLESPIVTTNLPEDEKIEKIAEHLEAALSVLGLDLTNDSTKDTHNRIAKMWVRECTYGMDYNKFPKIMTFENSFKNSAMVVEKNIGVKSMCSHHFVPVMGFATVAYVPKDRVLGLSKLNRIVAFFSRRPGEQERLVMQIQAAIAYVLETEDVAVYINAEHFCVKWRGVEDHLASMATSKLGGSFLTDAALRKEFYDIAK